MYVNIVGNGNVYGYVMYVKSLFQHTLVTSATKFYYYFAGFI